MYQRRRHCVNAHKQPQHLLTQILIEMKLTGAQKHLFNDLLSHSEWYIRKRANHNKNVSYCLFGVKACPIIYVQDRLTNSSFKTLLKTDSKCRMTLNLNTIRQLDGRSWVKKQYKKSKKQTNANTL